MFCDIEKNNNDEMESFSFKRKLGFSGGIFLVSKRKEGNLKCSIKVEPKKIRPQKP